MLVGSKMRKRVVVVDDSRTIQAMLELTLEGSPHFQVVGIAGDARSAVAMVDRLRPDMVTIDLCMPYIDGAELLQMLAERTDVCKVVVSDHAATNVAMVARLRDLGAMACIAKSELAADPRIFVEKLHSLVTSFQSGKGAQRSRPRHDLAPVKRTQGSPSVAPVLAFPVPADEEQRIAYLRRKKLANASREPQFDLLTQYLVRLSSFPICMMTFIDRDIMWGKSSYGLELASIARCESFCSHTIARDTTLIVRNAANDPVFARYPTVLGDPNVRTYVGHPIITSEGIHLGALCLIDTKVRMVSDVLVARLQGLAEIAAEMINQRPLLAA